MVYMSWFEKEKKVRGNQDILSLGFSFSFQHCCFILCEQVLFVRFYSNPAPVIRFMQFHYSTVSNPGTGADDAFVLKRCV